MPPGSGVPTWTEPPGGVFVLHLLAIAIYLSGVIPFISVEESNYIVISESIMTEQRDI